MMKRISIALCLLFCCMIPIEAKPRWASMMHDDKTNYFKAVKRFERYWKRHFLPNEEKENPNEHLQSGDPRPWITKLFQSEEKAREKSNRLIIDYKSFRKWKYEMLPYVKANGKLLSPEERLEAWKKLQLPE